jgi:DNA-binding PadR family transcriptional regulator
METIATVDRVDRQQPLQPAMFHILMALTEGDRHGYAIIQAIAARTDGRVRVGAGTLYRSLHRMAEDGLVREVNDRPASANDDERRRHYRLTPLGRRVARAEAQRLADLVQLARASGLAPARA